MLVEGDKSAGTAARSAGAGSTGRSSPLREQGVGDIAASIARAHTQMYAPSCRYLPSRCVEGIWYAASLESENDAWVTPYIRNQRQQSDQTHHRHDRFTPTANGLSQLSPPILHQSGIGSATPNTPSPASTERFDQRSAAETRRDPLVDVRPVGPTQRRVRASRSGDRRQNKATRGQEADSGPTARAWFLSSLLRDRRSLMSSRSWSMKSS